MIIKLFEELLQEVNYEKTRDTFKKKLLAGGMEDSTNPYAKPLVKAQQKGEDIDSKMEDSCFRLMYHSLENRDPTHGRKSKPDAYLIWLIIKYIKGGIKLWEDMPSMTELLSKYEELKKYDTFKKMHRAGAINAGELAVYNDIAKIAGKSELFTITSAATKWLAKHDADTIETNYRRYTDWAFRGGCKIIYPVGGTQESRRQRFAKYGMVIELKTVECSVDLFQKPTAWCTARPGNENFDEYSSDGPLIVIIDNVNKKFYQFHEHTRQYLDESDGYHYSALAIPLPLLKVALAATPVDMSSLLYHTSAGKLSKAMQSTVSKAMRNTTDTAGVSAWSDYYQGPNRYHAFDVIPLVDWYVNEKGELPSVEYVEAILYQLTDDEVTLEDGSKVHQIEENQYHGLLLAFMANPNAKPTQAIIEALFNGLKKVPAPVAYLAGYFHNTSVWPQARAEIMRLLENGEGNPTNIFLYDHRYAKTYYSGLTYDVPSAAIPRIPVFDIFDVMRFTREELGAILRGGAQTNSWGIGFLRVMAETNNPNNLPDEKSLVAQLAEWNGIGQHALLDAIRYQSKIKPIVAPLLDFEKMLSIENGKDGGPSPRGLDIIHEAASTQLYYHAFTPAFVSMMLAGMNASALWSTIRNMFPEEPGLEQTFISKKLLPVAKTALINSLAKHGAGKIAVGHFFYYHELCSQLTEADLSEILKAYARIGANGVIDGIFGPSFVLQEIFGVIQRKWAPIAQPKLMTFAFAMWTLICRDIGWTDWMSEMVDEYNIKLPRQFIESLYPYTGTGGIGHHKFVELCKMAGIQLPQEYLDKVPPVGQSHSVHVDDLHPLTGQPMPRFGNRQDVSDENQKQMDRPVPNQL